MAACRSLGIAARLNPVANEPEWASPGENPQWRRVKEMDSHTKDFPSAGTAELTLRVPEKQGLEYGSQISLGVWDGEDYRTLSYGDRKVEDGQRFTLDRGYYRILLSLRQIDGSVSARAMYLTLNGDREVTLRQREDQTGKKLRHVSLGDILVKKDGREGTLRKLWPHAPGILIRGHISFFLKCIGDFLQQFPDQKGLVVFGNREQRIASTLVYSLKISPGLQENWEKFFLETTKS